MIRRFASWFSIAAAVTLTTVAWAEPPAGSRSQDGPPRGDGPPRRGGPPEGRGGPPRGLPPLPVLQALDTDKDGEISSEEIANASAALKKLDKDDDGKLTRGEMLPDFAAMRGRGHFARPGDRPQPPFGSAGRRGERGPRDRGDGEERRRGPRPDGARRGPPPGGAMLDRIMAFDQDEDGKLSGDEIPARMQRMVSRIDTNHNKVIDRAEVEQMLRHRGGRRGAGRPRGEGDRPHGRRPSRDRREGRAAEAQQDSAEAEEDNGQAQEDKAEAQQDDA